MTKSTTPRTTPGPLIYENWKRFSTENSAGSLLEYQLFSDAPIYAEWRSSQCPYELVSVRRETPDTPRSPAAVVRLRHYWTVSGESVSPSSPPYHGGSLVDEIAALVALLLGIRIKASKNYSRRWAFNNDPFGEPICTEEPLHVPSSNYPMLPRASTAKNLGNMERILTLRDMSPESATSLILAARSYQEAVWIADQDPNYAWLLLVSAVETAAGAWSTASAPPLDRMKISRPALVDILVAAGGEMLATQVAEQIADYMGATKKFRDFLIHFLPEPPADRPDIAHQIDWDAKHFKKALERVYAFRSRALHGGVPYPLPLCTPPNGLEERPMWQSMSNLDGHSWQAKEVPMLLHTFEYIVRGALLKWWDSTTTNKTTLSKLIAEHSTHETLSSTSASQN